MQKNILILPERYEKVNTWWPYWVVLNLFKSDYLKKFKFIEKPWVIERSNGLSNTFLRRNIRKIGVIHVFSLAKYIIHLYVKLRVKNKLERLVISHDLFFAFCCLIYNKKINLTIVYHGQGPLYNEMLNLGWVWNSFFLRRFLEFLELFVFKKSTFIWFPSIWAYLAFQDSTSCKTRKYLDTAKSKIKILYNWIDSQQSSLDNPILNVAKNELIFTTVSTLNDEKGVDRAPKLIKFLIDHWIKLKWILIGNWKYLEKIQRELKELNISNQVTIFTNPFKKEEIIWLFQKSHFYLMLHRVSIFDYATLEAMNEGNIPILSDIWWNKEVIIDANGILIKEESIHNNNYSDLVKFINEVDFKKLKEKNKLIIQKHFSEKQFIENYYSLCKSMEDDQW